MFVCFFFYDVSFECYVVDEFGCQLVRMCVEYGSGDSCFLNYVEVVDE